MPAPPNMRLTVTGPNGANSSRMNSGSKGRPYMLVLDAWTDLRSSAYSVPPVAAPRM